ncbi:MAG: sodium:solute symporter family protein [bacterium]|nr:sodium:solute symporter family protein [bacterium]
MGKGTGLDFIVIIIYFTLILGFGTWFGRFTRSTKDFFFGGQRFSWWLISFSCIATLVGSYSFIKYSTAGYKYGFSSTMSYLNDWFIIPLFVIGWLPIIYFSRVVSIPEYFEKRFDKKTRKAAIVVLLTYLIGYIGINLFTIGVALQPLVQPMISDIFGIELGVKTGVFVIALVISIICGIYMHAGGQTSVIMTDLAQSFILILAGFVVFGLGIYYIGDFGTFWNSLDTAHKLPFAHFNDNPKFNSAGIFWQDGMANSFAFYFMNQGVLMRFMSVKSPKEGKRAIFMVVLVFMPLVAFVVSNAGWLGSSMVNLGLIPAGVNPDHIFVEVASRIAVPGVFGFIMAALTAALMSTIDTLINAVSAISVNDIVKEIKPDMDDSYYLKWAKYVAIFAALFGLALVPLFQSFHSIYVAHGAFTAAITPPMVITILFAAFWKRYTTTAAFATIVGGGFMVGLSIAFPVLVSPFAQGVDPDGYKYMRALYGLVTCGAIGIIVTFCTKPKSKEELAGLVVDSIEEAKRRFKGGRKPNDDIPGKKYRGILEIKTEMKDIEGVSLSREAMDCLKAEVGDIIYVSDSRWWYGGLRSVQLMALDPHNLGDNIVLLSEIHIIEAKIDSKRPVVMEKII